MMIIWQVSSREDIYYGSTNCPSPWSWWKDGKSQDELDPIKTSACLLMFIRPCKSKYSGSLYLSPGRLAQAPALRAAKGYFKMNGNSPTPGRGKYLFLCPPSHNISIFRYSEMKARGRIFLPTAEIFPTFCENMKMSRQSCPYSSKYFQTFRPPWNFKTDLTRRWRDTWTKCLCILLSSGD